MRIRYCICCVLFVMSMASVVMADEEDEGFDMPIPYKETVIDDACQQNALTMANCMAKQVEESDVYLRSLMTFVEKHLLSPSEQIDAFRDANSSWFDYRDQSCRFDSSIASGNSYSGIYSDCIHSYNKARIHLLTRYLRCLNGECSNDFKLYYLID